MGHLSFHPAVNRRKRRRRRRRKQARYEIPMDLVMEILMRLPAKSLMRFKCVSKFFSSQIRSQYFSNRLLTITSRPRPRLYMCLKNREDYRKSVIQSLVPDTTTHPSSFVVDHDLTIPQRGGYILQKLGDFMYYTFDEILRIYNPSTRQLVNLPPIETNFNPPGEELQSIVSYLVGHDPVNDQYKVICTIGKAMRLQDIEIEPDASDPHLVSEYWVYVLKARGSWKKAAPPNPADCCPHFPIKRGLSLNGVIYYLAYLDMYTLVVVIFDIGSEKFKMIKLPCKDGEELTREVKKVSIIEHGGKVTLVDQTNLRDKGTMELWVVEDAGNKVWSRKTLVLQPSQLHLVNNITLKLRRTTQSGKVLFKPLDLVSPFHIICYDLLKNDMRKIEIKGIPDHWFSMDQTNTYIDLMFMDHSESVTYLDLNWSFL